MGNYRNGGHIKTPRAILRGIRIVKVSLYLIVNLMVLKRQRHLEKHLEGCLLKVAFFSGCVFGRLYSCH